MRSISLFIYTLLLFSCSDTGNLFKSTRSTKNGAYVVFIVDPNQPVNFYDKLYDSLNVHISKINGNKPGDFERSVEKDSFLGWLQEQFDNEQTGLGQKASSTQEIDRTSDEFLLNRTGAFSKDKVSFSVDYQTASIPNVFLYPDLWKKNRQCEWS